MNKDFIKIIFICVFYIHTIDAMGQFLEETSRRATALLNEVRDFARQDQEQRQESRRQEQRQGAYRQGKCGLTPDVRQRMHDLLSRAEPIERDDNDQDQLASSSAYLLEQDMQQQEELLMEEDIENDIIMAEIMTILYQKGLSDDQVKERTEKILEKIREARDDNECPICFGEFFDHKGEAVEQLAITDCNNIIHRKCLLSSRRQGGDNACPLCRGTDDLKDIYLGGQR